VRDFFSSDDHRKADMGAGGAITTMQVPNGTTPVPPSKRANGVDEAKPGSRSGQTAPASDLLVQEHLSVPTP